MSRKDSDTTVMVGCFLLFLTLPLMILVRAFVLAQMWEWFIVPFGVMAITYGHAVGLSILINLFHPSKTPSKSDEESDESVKKAVARFIFTGLVMPFIALGAGWLCKYFM